MIFKNYYKLLGLNNNIKSTPSEIKTAYREQAKKYHPDVNVNNKAAEERFKDINEGYRILSDSVQKRKYDKSWYNYVGKKIQKEESSKKEVKVNDIVKMFFGVNNCNDKVKENPIKGENIETRIDISIKEAFDGTQKNIALSSTNGKNKTIKIDIPSGIKNGSNIRLEGKGKKGKNGGTNGDLIIKVNIVNNATYKLVNDDIYLKVYLTPWDAALGAKLNVNNIDGEVSILMPKGTQTGDKITIPNKGYYIENEKRGNLIIKAEIAIPKKLTENEKNLFGKLKEISKFNPNNIVNIK